MRTARVRAAVAVVAVVVAAAGCGGGDDAAPADGPGAAEATTPVAGARASHFLSDYLAAMAADGGPDTDAMAELTAPGSVAERYARHLGAVADVQRAAGEPAEQGTATVEGDGVLLRLEPAGGGDPVELTWADFTLDEDGRLVDFTIDGETLDDRLVVDGASDTVDGVTATVTSAFELVSNDSPLVVVEIDNGGAGRLRLVGADYEAPDGRVLTTSPSDRGLVVPRGATNRVILAFARAPFGGTVTLHAVVGGDAPLDIDLPLTP
ncbi:MAG: hypothetical protein KDB35_08440 [Acidimicrobiales bacterium]|nr:hypothetical protein [Acidimicrobiales bacterium]